MYIKKTRQKSLLPKVAAIAMLSISISLAGEITVSNALPSDNNTIQTRANSFQSGKVKPCDFLNIRKGPGVDNSVIGKAYTNQDVKVLEMNNNGWYRVQISDGTEGWVSGAYVSIAGENVATKDSVKKVIDIAYKQQGKTYRWGSAGPSSFDCSGFTSYVYKQGANVNLPRVSREQATVGKQVNRNQLQAGDLLFFTSFGSGINHVGMYIGDSKFIHSPQAGDVVKIDKLDSSYYSKTFVTARRVL